MDWSVYAIPVATVLGALIGGIVSLRINATQAQRGVVEEFPKLSAAQAAQLDNLHAELGRLRERTAVLERNAETFEKRYLVARGYISRVMCWDREGRVGDLPPVPDLP